MSLLRKNRKGVGRLLKQTYTLSLAFAVLLFAGSAVSSPAQLPKVPAPEPKAEPAAPLDPLGRQTPRSSLINLLKYEASGDYATAARFLQLPPGREPGRTHQGISDAKPELPGQHQLGQRRSERLGGSGASAWPGTCWCRDGGWHNRRRDPGARGRSCRRKNMAGFAGDAGRVSRSSTPGWRAKSQRKPIESGWPY